MATDVNAALGDIMQKYSDDERAQKMNCILYGGVGSGKTYALRTLPAPILLHSFDPGGSKSLREEIDKGRVFADRSFEDEDPQKPSQFERWTKEFERLYKLKVDKEVDGEIRKVPFFSQIGTFVLDSMTMWSQAALNHVLKKRGAAGQTPAQNDWFPQMVMLENAMHYLLSIPCNVVIIGHDDYLKDELTGRISRNVMITGKLVKRIPLRFDECYVMTNKRTAKGTEFMFRTQSNSEYEARSRLGSGGRLNELEPADFKVIMKKVGLPHEDKK